jgi:hypothetical protein
MESQLSEKRQSVEARRSALVAPANIEGLQSAGEGEGSAAPSLDDFADTPLTRLCLIPMNRIEKNEIDELNLNGKGMTNFEAMILGDLLRNNSSLRRLDLRNNPLISKGAMLQSLLGPLRNHPRLQEVSGIPLRALKTARNLNLTGQGLGDPEASLLTELCRGTRLRDLNLKDNNFTPVACRELLQLLEACPTLESISDLPVQDIMKNKVGGVRAHCRGLGDFEAFILADLLSQNKSLREVSAEGNVFKSTEAAEALAKSVMSHPNLEVFSGIPVQALRNGDLDTLDMRASKYPLGDFGCVLVAECVRRSAAAAHLRRLDLSENGIGFTGFSYLAQSVSCCPKLEFLDLQGNADMTRDTLIEILSALDCAPSGVRVNLFGAELNGEEFTTLKRVLDGSLGGSEIGAFEVRLIRVALQYLGFLTSLDLKGTTMRRVEAIEVLIAVEGAFSENLIVYMWGFPVHRHDAAAVRQLLEKEVGNSCPIFKIAAVLGTKHGTTSTSKDAESTSDETESTDS